MCDWNDVLILDFRLGFIGGSPGLGCTSVPAGGVHSTTASVISGLVTQTTTCYGTNRPWYTSFAD